MSFATDTTIETVGLDVLDDAENWVDSQVLDIPSIADPIGISVSETRCRYLRFYVLSTYNEGSQAYGERLVLN